MASAEEQEVAALSEQATEVVLALAHPDDFGRPDVLTSFTTIKAVFGMPSRANDPTAALLIPPQEAAALATRVANSRASLALWRARDRLRILHVGVALCLGVGADLPGDDPEMDWAGAGATTGGDPSTKAPRVECWIDVNSPGHSHKKIDDAVMRSLVSGYYKFQPKALVKPVKDNAPTVDHIRKLLTTLRKWAAKDGDRVLFHYNGHGMPRPTPAGELWCLSNDQSAYHPLHARELKSWLGAPSMYVLDCSNAGLVIPHLTGAAAATAAGPSSTSAGSSAAPATPGEAAAAAAASDPCEPYILASCRAEDSLPNHPSIPADLFTACLMTPIKVSLVWALHSGQAGIVLPRAFRHLIDRLPGKLSEKRSPLGELNWLLVSLTDTIAWTRFPRTLFLRLFRQDVLVATLFRNFLLADRIMRQAGCTPASNPPLPRTHDHPLWAHWDGALTSVLAQLPSMLGFTTFDMQRLEALGQGLGSGVVRPADTVIHAQAWANDGYVGDPFVEPSATSATSALPPLAGNAGGAAAPSAAGPAATAVAAGPAPGAGPTEAPEGQAGIKGQLKRAASGGIPSQAGGAQQALQAAQAGGGATEGTLGSVLPEVSAPGMPAQSKQWAVLYHALEGGGQDPLALSLPPAASATARQRVRFLRHRLRHVQPTVITGLAPPPPPPVARSFGLGGMNPLIHLARPDRQGGVPLPGEYVSMSASLWQGPTPEAAAVLDRNKGAPYAYTYINTTFFTDALEGFEVWLRGASWLSLRDNARIADTLVDTFASASGPPVVAPGGPAGTGATGQSGAQPFGGAGLSSGQSPPGSPLVLSVDTRRQGKAGAGADSGADGRRGSLQDESGKENGGVGELVDASGRKMLSMGAAARKAHGALRALQPLLLPIQAGAGLGPGTGKSTDGKGQAGASLASSAPLHPVPCIAATRIKAPDQLPVLLQMVLSGQRRRAVELFARFLDLGPEAVNLALLVGLQNYVMRLLASAAETSANREKERSERAAVDTKDTELRAQPASSPTAAGMAAAGQGGNGASGDQGLPLGGYTGATVLILAKLLAVECPRSTAEELVHKYSCVAFMAAYVHGQADSRDKQVAARAAAERERAMAGAGGDTSAGDAGGDRTGAAQPAPEARPDAGAATAAAMAVEAEVRDPTLAVTSDQTGAALFVLCKLLSVYPQACAEPSVRAHVVSVVSRLLAAPYPVAGNSQWALLALSRLLVHDPHASGSGAFDSSSSTAGQAMPVALAIVSGRQGSLLPSRRCAHASDLGTDRLATSKGDKDAPKKAAAQVPALTATEHERAALYVPQLTVDTVLRSLAEPEPAVRAAAAVACGQLLAGSGRAAVGQGSGVNPHAGPVPARAEPGRAPSPPTPGVPGGTWAVLSRLAANSAETAVCQLALLRNAPDALLPQGVVIPAPAATRAGKAGGGASPWMGPTGPPSGSMFALSSASGVLPPVSTPMGPGMSSGGLASGHGLASAPGLGSAAGLAATGFHSTGSMASLHLDRSTGDVSEGLKDGEGARAGSRGPMSGLVPPPSSTSGGPPALPASSSGPVVNLNLTPSALGPVSLPDMAIVAAVELFVPRAGQDNTAGATTGKPTVNTGGSSGSGAGAAPSSLSGPEAGRNMAGTPLPGSTENIPPLSSSPSPSDGSISVQQGSSKESHGMRYLRAAWYIAYCIVGSGGTGAYPLPLTASRSQAGTHLLSQSVKQAAAARSERRRWVLTALARRMKRVMVPASAVVDVPPVVVESYRAAAANLEAQVQVIQGQAAQAGAGAGGYPAGYSGAAEPSAPYRGSLTGGSIGAGMGQGYGGQGAPGAGGFDSSDGGVQAEGWALDAAVGMPLDGQQAFVAGMQPIQGGLQMPTAIGSAVVPSAAMSIQGFQQPYRHAFATGDPGQGSSAGPGARAAGVDGQGGGDSGHRDSDSELVALPSPVPLSATVPTVPQWGPMPDMTAGVEVNTGLSIRIPSVGRMVAQGQVQGGGTARRTNARPSQAGSRPAPATGQSVPAQPEQGSYAFDSTGSSPGGATPLATVAAAAAAAATGKAGYGVHGKYSTSQQLAVQPQAPEEPSGGDETGPPPADIFAAMLTAAATPLVGGQAGPVLSRASSMPPLGLSDGQSDAYGAPMPVLGRGSSMSSMPALSPSATQHGYQRDMSSSGTTGQLVRAGSAVGRSILGMVPPSTPRRGQEASSSSSGTGQASQPEMTVGKVPRPGMSTSASTPGFSGMGGATPASPSVGNRIASALGRGSSRAGDARTNKTPLLGPSAPGRAPDAPAAAGPTGQASTGSGAVPTRKPVLEANRRARAELASNLLSKTVDGLDAEFLELAGQTPLLVRHVCLAVCLLPGLTDASPAVRSEVLASVSSLLACDAAHEAALTTVASLSLLDHLTGGSFLLHALGLSLSGAGGIGAGIAAGGLGGMGDGVPATPRAGGPSTPAKGPLSALRTDGSPSGPGGPSFVPPSPGPGGGGPNPTPRGKSQGFLKRVMGVIGGKSSSDQTRSPSFGPMDGPDTPHTVLDPGSDGEGDGRGKTGQGQGKFSPLLGPSGGPRTGRGDGMPTLGAGAAGAGVAGSASRTLFGAPPSIATARDVRSLGLGLPDDILTVAWLSSALEYTTAAYEHAQAQAEETDVSGSGAALDGAATAHAGRGIGPGERGPWSWLVEPASGHAGSGNVPHAHAGQPWAAVVATSAVRTLGLPGALYTSLWLALLSSINDPEPVVASFAARLVRRTLYRVVETAGMAAVGGLPVQESIPSLLATLPEGDGEVDRTGDGEGGDTAATVMALRTAAVKARYRVACADHWAGAFKPPVHMELELSLTPGLGRASAAAAGSGTTGHGASTSLAAATGSPADASVTMADPSGSVHFAYACTRFYRPLLRPWSRTEEEDPLSSSSLRNAARQRLLLEGLTEGTLLAATAYDDNTVRALTEAAAKVWDGLQSHARSVRLSGKEIVIHPSGGGDTFKVVSANKMSRRRDRLHSRQQGGGSVDATLQVLVNLQPYMPFAQLPPGFAMRLAQEPTVIPGLPRGTRVVRLADGNLRLLGPGESLFPSVYIPPQLQPGWMGMQAQVASASPMWPGMYSLQPVDPWMASNRSYPEAGGVQGLDSGRDVGAALYGTGGVAAGVVPGSSLGFGFSPQMGPMTSTTGGLMSMASLGPSGLGPSGLGPNRARVASEEYQGFQSMAAGQGMGFTSSLGAGARQSYGVGSASLAHVYGSSAGYGYSSSAAGMTQQELARYGLLAPQATGIGADDGLGPLRMTHGTGYTSGGSLYGMAPSGTSSGQELFGRATANTTVSSGLGGMGGMGSQPLLARADSSQVMLRTSSTGNSIGMNLSTAAIPTGAYGGYQGYIAGYGAFYGSSLGAGVARDRDAAMGRDPSLMFMSGTGAGGSSGRLTGVPGPGGATPGVLQVTYSTPAYGPMGLELGLPLSPAIGPAAVGAGGLASAHLGGAGGPAAGPAGPTMAARLQQQILAQQGGAAPGGRVPSALALPTAATADDTSGATAGGLRPVASANFLLGDAALGPSETTSGQARGSLSQGQGPMHARTLSAGGGVTYAPAAGAAGQGQPSGVAGAGQGSGGGAGVGSVLGSVNDGPKMQRPPTGPAGLPSALPQAYAPAPTEQAAAVPRPLPAAGPAPPQGRAGQPAVTPALSSQQQPGVAEASAAAAPGPEIVTDVEMEAIARAASSLTPRLSPPLLARIPALAVRLARASARRLSQRAVIDVAPHANMTSGLLFHPTEDIIFAAGGGDVISAWDTRDGEKRGRFSVSTGVAIWPSWGGAGQEDTSPVLGGMPGPGADAGGTHSHGRSSKAGLAMVNGLHTSSSGAGGMRAAPLWSNVLSASVRGRMRSMALSTGAGSGAGSVPGKMPWTTKPPSALSSVNSKAGGLPTPLKAGGKLPPGPAAPQNSLRRSASMQRRPLPFLPFGSSHAPAEAEHGHDDASGAGTSGSMDHGAHGRHAGPVARRVPPVITSMLWLDEHAGCHLATGTSDGVVRVWTGADVVRGWLGGDDRAGDDMDDGGHYRSGQAKTVGRSSQGSHGAAQRGPGATLGRNTMTYGSGSEYSSGTHGEYVGQGWNHDGPGLVTTFNAMPELKAGLYGTGYGGLGHGSAAGEGERAHAAGAGLMLHWLPGYGRLVAGGGSQGYLRIWDLHTQRCAYTVNCGLEPGQGITSISCAWPGAHIMVLGTSTGAIHVVDTRLASAALAGVSNVGSRGPTGIGSNPAVRNTGSISISSGAALGPLPSPMLSGAAHGYGFGPSSSSGSAVIKVFHEHTRYVTGVAQARAGSAYSMVSASIAGDIRFWDLREGHSVATVQTSKDKGGLTAMALHDYAPLLATGSALKQNVRVFTNSGEHLCELKHHEGFTGQRIGPVSTLAWHPHRLLLAVGSTDNYIGLYHGSPPAKGE